MNQYVTGAMIKLLREKAGLSQVQLAQKLNVSDKTISKWETGKGYPDVSLLEQRYFQFLSQRYYQATRLATKIFPAICLRGSFMSALSVEMYYLVWEKHILVAME